MLGKKNHRRMHRRTWFLVFAIGFLVIFVANLLYSRSPDQSWLWAATVILVVLMVLYGWVVRGNPEASVDIKADGIYYLGLLFTFTALVATLVFPQILNSSEDGLSEQLIPNFGIALITTIFGLAGRVLFTMTQNSPGDVGASAAQSLIDGAAKMETQIAKATEKMEHLVWRLNRSLKTYEEAPEIISTLTEFANDANDRFHDATRRFSQRVDDLYQPLIDADQRLSKLTDQYDELNGVIVKTLSQLSSFNAGEFTSGISKFQEEVHDTTQYLQRFKASLEHSGNQIINLGNKVEREALTLDSINNLDKQIKELSDCLSGFTNDLTSLQSTLTNIVQTSQTVSVTVTRSGEIIQHASNVVEQASDPFRQIETTINDLPTDVVHLHKEVVQLSDSLATANKKSGDLQAKLDLAHNSVPSPIISRLRKWIKWLMGKWPWNSETVARNEEIIQRASDDMEQESDPPQQSVEPYDSVPEKPVSQDVLLSSDWWLCPQNIIRSKHLSDVFCLGYRIGQSIDKWTVRINGFKTEKPHTIRKAEATLHVAAPSLFRRIDIDPDNTVVIPALNSKQTAGSADSKNSRLAKAIANGAGAKFVFDCLKENKHEPLHLQPSAPARDQALNDASYRAARLKCENVMIVDDIVTRGATMSAIAKAIHLSNPDVKIFGFALGRHIRPEYSHSSANAKIPRELAEIWDRT